MNPMLGFSSRLTVKCDHCEMRLNLSASLFARGFLNAISTKSLASNPQITSPTLVIDKQKFTTRPLAQNLNLFC